MRTKPFLALLVSGLAAACGGDTPARPAIHAISLDVAVPGALRVGVVDIRALATMTDGAIRDVTAEATWTSDPPGVVRVVAGVATVSRSGPVEVIASWQGLRGRRRLLIPRRASFTFMDPVGDQRGRVDVTSLSVDFDPQTGLYEVVMTADPRHPFVGRFVVNLNMFNPDLGTRALDPSMFQSHFNEFDPHNPEALLRFSGGSPSLRAWRPGHRVAADSTTFGNPDDTIFFRCSAHDLPYRAGGRAFEDEDTIGYGDVAMVQEQ